MIHEQCPEQMHQLALGVAIVPQESVEVDLVGGGGVAMAAHVAASLLMLDEQASRAGVEHKSPAVVVGAFVALVQRLSQKRHDGFLDQAMTVMVLATRGLASTVTMMRRVNRIT